MTLSWILLFLAAIHTLAAVSPAVVSQFHGGAHDTATKVGSALAVLDVMTTPLNAGNHPLTGIEEASIHPELAAHAASLAAPPAAPPV